MHHTNVHRSKRIRTETLAANIQGSAGLLLLSTIDRDTTPLGLAPFLVIMGFGTGLAFPNMTIGVQNTPGAMVMTRMPTRVSSRAIGSAIATTPPREFPWT